MEQIFYFDKTGLHHKAELISTNSDGTIDLKFLDKRGKSHKKTKVVPKENAKLLKSNSIHSCYKIVEHPD